MKGRSQRFCWRMEQNKNPPIAEGPGGRGGEVVQWSWAWRIHSKVLGWIKEGGRVFFATLGPGQCPDTELCCPCAFDQNLVPQQLFPIQIPRESKSLLLRKFQLYRMCATRLEKNPSESSQLSQSSIEWGWADPCCSWSWLQREDLPLSCLSTTSFQWFPGSCLRSHQLLRIPLLPVFL